MLIHRLTFNPAIGVDNRNLILGARVVVIRDHDHCDDINQAYDHALFSLRAKFGCHFTLDAHEKQMVQG